MARGDDIKERLVDFAARIIKVCNAFPRTAAGRHIAGQLVRSGTAPAAHHAEARGAESTADFIHKLRIAVKELIETEVWLRIIINSEILAAKKLGDLLDECIQLERILNSSIATARKSSER